MTDWRRNDDAWEDWSSHHGPGRIRPDAYAEVRLEIDGAEGRAGAFVEVDFATMDQARLRAKVARHRRYCAETVWWDRHPCCPALLLVTTSEARVSRFLTGVDKDRPRRSVYAGVHTVAALSELWLGLADHGPEGGLTLTGWRRLPNGLSYADPRTGVDRRLAADAELTVRLGGIGVRAFLFARTDRIPRTRLGPVVTRWSAYLATAASATSPHLPIAALVLTRTERQRMTVLDALWAWPARPSGWRSPPSSPAVVRSPPMRCGAPRPAPAIVAWRTCSPAWSRPVSDGAPSGITPPRATPSPSARGGRRRPPPSAR